jgi:hypothetical protein
MVANPPYGERIGEAEELARFYPKLGDALKKNFAGWNCFFFTADRRMEKLIRLQAAIRVQDRGGQPPGLAILTAFLSHLTGAMTRRGCHRRERCQKRYSGFFGSKSASVSGAPRTRFS